MNYFNFHIGDYIRDTHHLTLMEDIAYRRLIDFYYINEKPISNDVEFIARKLDMKSEEDTVKSILEEFFTIEEDGFYHHARCDIEIERYQSNSAVNSRAGKASAAAKKARKEQLQPQDSTKKEPKETKEPKEPFILPTGINKKAWGEFEQHRKEINKPLTDLARKKSVNILKDLSLEEQQTCINYSISGRYTGLFPQKNKNNQFKTAQQLRDEKNQAYLDRFDNNNIEGEIL